MFALYAYAFDIFIFFILFEDIICYHTIAGNIVLLYINYINLVADMFTFMNVEFQVLDFRS